MEGVPDGEGAWGTRAAVPAWWGKTEDPPKRPLQAGGATEGGGARGGVGPSAPLSSCLGAPPSGKSGDDASDWGARRMEVLVPPAGLVGDGF